MLTRTIAGKYPCLRISRQTSPMPKPDGIPWSQYHRINWRDGELPRQRSYRKLSQQIRSPPPKQLEQMQFQEIYLKFSGRVSPFPVNIRRLIIRDARLLLGVIHVQRSAQTSAQP